MAFSRTVSTVRVSGLAVALTWLPMVALGQSESAPVQGGLPETGAETVSTSTAKQVLKGLHPYAFVGLTYDSNLLLVSDSPVAKAALQEFIGTGETSDWYSTLGAGFDSEITKGQQRFLFNGQIYRNSYDRFNELDFTGGDARAQWKWAAGRLWSGTLGYDFSRSLKSFANQDIPERDVINRNRVYGDANRWISERWRVGASADWTDIAFSSNTTQDRNLYGGGLGLDYVTLAGNSVGLEARVVDARFKNVPARDYTKLDVGPVADWRVTGTTRLRAAAGYARQTYDKTPERDYDGPVGRLTAIWDATGKTRITSEIWRDISSLGDEIATYAIVDGISIEPQWAITPKTLLKAFAGYERRDFSGSRDLPDGIPGNLPVDGDRVDDVYTYLVGAEWKIRENVILSVEYNAGNRDSTRALQDYDYQAIQGQLRVGL